jgi:hypothetical protein
MSQSVFCPKNSMYPFPTLSSLPTTVLFIVSIVLPSSEYYKIAISHGLSLKIRSSGSSMAHLFLVLRKRPLSGHATIHFSNSLTENIPVFQDSAIMNKAATNISEQVLFADIGFHSFGEMPMSMTAESLVNRTFSL